MVSCTCRFRTRCAIGAAFALAVAVLAAPTAGADDGQGTSLPDVHADPSGLVAAVESAIAEGTAAAVVEETVAATLDGPPPSAAGVQEPARELNDDDAVSEPVTAPAIPGAAPVASDTTVQTPDTSRDTPAHVSEPGRSTAAAAVGVQVSPTNVNVSVRVASPGENGPVTQVNAVETAARAALTVTAGTSTRPPAEGATAGGTGSTDTGSKATGSYDNGSKAASVSPTESREISPTDSSSGTWNWRWDCFSSPAFEFASPAGSTGGITPSTWIWNWNCGENNSQYHGETIGQYQPINVNVGIRISSPGDDGPVAQTNVVVAIGVGGDTGAAESAPAPPIATAPVEASAPTENLAPGSPATSGGAAGEVTSGIATIEAVVLPPADEDVDPSHGTSRSTGGIASFVGAAGGGMERLVFPGLRRDAESSALPLVAIRASSRPRALAPSDVRQAGSKTEQPTASKAAPRWRETRGIRGSITGQPTGTSAAPAGAGGSSSGGLPIVLALPFLAAVLDMARRLVLDRVATPSGHRGRVPDDPG